MKNFINKINNKFLKTCKYTTFLTIDNNSISGLVYKNNNDNFQEEDIICKFNNEIKGVEQNIIYSKTKYSHSIAKCIDELEEKSNMRVKNVILNLVGFNSKSLTYSLNLKDITNFNVNNLLNYINPKEIGYYLGNEYILTNLLPLNINNNYDNSIPMHFLIAGFKKEYIFEILDIFYNLSLDINNILFSPLLLPYAFSNHMYEDFPILIISSDYTLLYSSNSIEFIAFGTNIILEYMSKKTHIPYNTLKKYIHVINQILISNEEPLLYRIDDFVVDNIKQVVDTCLENYLVELKHLITSKNLHKHDKIIVLNNNLKFLMEQNLLPQFDVLNIEFSNINVDTKFINLKISIPEILNKAAIRYYKNKISSDLALTNFDKRINEILENYKY